MIISQLQNTHRSQDLIQLCLLVIVDVMYTCTEHASDYIDIQFAALEMVYT